MRAARVLLLGLWALLAIAPSVRASDPALPEVSFGDMMALKTKQDGDNTIVTFPAVLSALNDKTVTIRGWITPINLGDGTTVTSFLLTGTPGTCPFCWGMGPEAFILVSAAQPIPSDVTVELQLKGKFEALQNDPTGFYYRLRDATVIGHPSS
jgi:hypothetical protein